MKKLLLRFFLLLAGAGVGAGSGVAAHLLLGPHSVSQAKAATPSPTTFVPLPRMLAPLVLPDGSLSGYVAFELQLGVGEKDAPRVTAELPLLQHAINMRTYRTPLAAGADGALPDIDLFRRVTMDAAKQVFGPGVVRRVAVTQALPA
ncbi:MAG: hypothetical protein ACTHMG_02135 [Sphingomonas sp.]